MKKYLFISLTFLIIASCGSTSGNRVLLAESELSVDSKIIEGVTTQSEIKAMFGSPFETTFTDGGMEIWKYRFDNLDGTYFMDNKISEQRLDQLKDYMKNNSFFIDKFVLIKNCDGRY